MANQEIPSPTKWTQYPLQMLHRFGRGVFERADVALSNPCRQKGSPAIQFSVITPPHNCTLLEILELRRHKILQCALPKLVSLYSCQPQVPEFFSGIRGYGLESSVLAVTRAAKDEQSVRLSYRKPLEPDRVPPESTTSCGARRTHLHQHNHSSGPRPLPQAQASAER